MKKNLLTAILLLSTIALTAQINIISTSFYSQALDETKMVNVFLPPGYDANPDLHYPVIYFLHGWQGNQNSGNPEMNTAYTMINQGLIEPVIIVCAHNSPAPFGGSVYTNSILWGDYETYMTEDLCNWVESTYRAMPGKQYRAVFGMSMGGYGAFRYGILHNDKYCALAACAAPVSFLEGNMRTQFRQMILQANQPGPPYTYNFATGGPFTQIYFLYYGAFVPNYNTPQTYINPAILEFPLDENGNYIDTILAKVIPHDIASLINQLTPESSPGIYFGCGTNDPFFLYPGNLDVKDSLVLYSIPYTFYSHGGGHIMPAEFTENAFMFLDSLLMPPVIPCSCLPQGITFATQAQIDNFQTNYPGCTEIEGEVKIGGYNITNLNGLSVLTSIVGNMKVGTNWNSNPSLTSLNGLESLTSIGGYLTIYCNSALTNLTGLENLTTIGDYLEINANSALTSLTGLENLTSIGDYSFEFGWGNLEITHNQSLTNMTGLEGLVSIGGDINIYGNDSLISLNGLEGLTDIPGNVMIGYFTGMGESFGNPMLASLTGLDNLTNIGGNLTIWMTTSLNSMNGLENLVSIGGNLIIRHQVINSLTGLENLTTIEGYFEIGFNDSLASLTGLDNLFSIGEHLLIYENAALTGLMGLDNLGSIGGGLDISSNNSLNSLIGLNNLTTIGDGFWIYENSSLNSLTGLENLISIGGDLWIGGYWSSSGNPELTSLTGLDNIAASSITNLNIGYNSSLSTCEVQSICDYLAAPNGTVTISNNAPGCNSQAQVIAACETTGIEETISEKGFSISPNPFTGQLSIEFYLPQTSTVSIQIFNAMGAKVAELHHGQMPAGQQQFRWDAGDLPEGLYFCRVQAGNEMKMLKIIKH